jgi:hypothetical protein
MLYYLFVFVYVAIKISGVCCVYAVKVKQAKVIPLHAWTGPQGSRRLRLPDF